MTKEVEALRGSCSLYLFSRCRVISYSNSGWLHFKILSVLQQDHSSGGFKVVLLPVVRWVDWPLQRWIMDNSLKQTGRLKHRFRTCQTGGVIIKFLSQVSFIQNDNFCHLFCKVVRHGPQCLARIQITVVWRQSAEQSTLLKNNKVNCKGRYARVLN